jgi:hypothetical protein
MEAMATYEHLLKSYDVRDQLDEIASADPPAYLRRCLAEGFSASTLSFTRIQQLTVCVMVLDAVVNGRDYEVFEHELIADWRIHYAGACAKLKDSGVQVLHRILEHDRPQDPDAVAEIEQLASSVAATNG